MNPAYETTMYSLDIPIDGIWPYVIDIIASAVLFLSIFKIFIKPDNNTDENTGLSK